MKFKVVITGYIEDEVENYPLDTQRRMIEEGLSFKDIVKQNLDENLELIEVVENPTMTLENT